MLINLLQMAFHGNLKILVNKVKIECDHHTLFSIEGEKMKEKSMNDRFSFVFYFMVVLSFCGILYLISSTILSFIFGSLDAKNILISYIQGFIISFVPAFLVVYFTKNLNAIRLLLIFFILVVVEIVIPVGVASGIEDAQLDDNVFYTLAEVLPYFKYGYKFIICSLVINMIAMAIPFLLKKN